MQLFNLLAVSDGAVFAGLTGVWLVFVIIALLASVFWIWMLIDCLTSSLQPMEKLLWFLVIFFLHIIGAVLYYVIGRTGSRANMA